MNDIKKLLLRQLQKHSTHYVESSVRGIVVDDLDVDSFIDEVFELVEVKKGETPVGKKRYVVDDVLSCGYALRFNEPDSEGNAILSNSFDAKEFEQMKIAGDIIDYVVDDKGVKVTKRVDIASLPLFKGINL